MSDLLPAFSAEQVLWGPWTGYALLSNVWIALMGFFVTAACGLVGNYLILRRMSLVGDAISHSVLPGIAIAFLLAQTRGTMAMFLGALAAGVVTTIIIETIYRRTKVKEDAAIGIAFTTLFAIGVILISLYTAQIDLDQECVLYGEIGFVGFEPMVTLWGATLGPLPVLRMGLVLLATAILILLFYKELLVSSFDPGLAVSLGINATALHYGLMCWLSIVVVSAFEAVGAILVVAMLIFPGATAALLSQRLPVMLAITLAHAALSSVLGIHLAHWLDCSVAGAMVVMGSMLFGLAWLFSPTDGLARRRTVPQGMEQGCDGVGE